MKADPKHRGGRDQEGVTGRWLNVSLEDILLRQHVEFNPTGTDAHAKSQLLLNRIKRHVSFVNDPAHPDQKAREQFVKRMESLFPHGYDSQVTRFDQMPFV